MTDRDYLIKSGWHVAVIASVLFIAGGITMGYKTATIHTGRSFIVNDVSYSPGSSGYESGLLKIRLIFGSLSIIFCSLGLYFAYAGLRDYRASKEITSILSEVLTLKQLEAQKYRLSHALFGKLSVRQFHY